MVFEPGQGFQPGLPCGLGVVTVAGIVEEGVVSPRICNEFVALSIGLQRRFKTRGSCIDSGVLLAVNS